MTSLIRAFDETFPSSGLMMPEDKHPQSERKIRVPSVSVDIRDEVRDGGLLRRGNRFDLNPERVFQADTCLVTIDDDRSLDEWRLHCWAPFTAGVAGPNLRLIRGGIVI
jgi:hypothetical protein